jgi:multiple sugar transport system permease protein
MATINVSRARARGLPATAGKPGPAAARRGPTLGRRLRRSLTGYFFLAGAIICFALWSWYPMIHEILLSFQHLNLVGQSEGWGGWRNYEHMLNDPNFWTSVRVTLVFTGLALIFGYAVPFVLAVGLNEFRHAAWYFRLLVYLPVMLPPVAAAFLWKWFYTPDNSGLFNAVLHDLHLPTSTWLQSSNNTFVILCMVIFSTWSNMGSGVLIYMAALQGIPGELYEAAELDGAGILKRVWHVTIPQTRLILSLMLLLQIVATMQTFTESLVLTGGANGTGTLVYLVYQDATNFNNFGGSAAIGTVLLLVLGAFSGAYLWLNRRGEE